MLAITLCTVGLIAASPISTSSASLSGGAPSLELQLMAGGQSFTHTQSRWLYNDATETFGLGATLRMPNWMEGLSARASLHFTGESGGYDSSSNPFNSALSELSLGAIYEIPEISYRDSVGERLAPYVRADISLGWLVVRGIGDLRSDSLVPGAALGIGSKFFFGAHRERFSGRRYYAFVDTSYTLRLSRALRLATPVEESEDPDYVAIDTTSTRIGDAKISSFLFDVGFGMRF